MSRKRDLTALALCLHLAFAAPAAATEEDAAPSAETLEQWITAGKNYYDGGNRLIRQDRRKALQAFEQAAKYDHPEAYYYIGNIYQEGKDVPPDEEKAMSNYAKAALLGQPDSQMILGVQHVMNGIRMKPNSAEQKMEYTNAVNWLKKAAEQGVPEAKYWYGDMLVKGLGTDKDETKGRTLIREAAEAGNANGQAMLSALYWQGQAGLEKDLAAAYKWMRISARNGNENAGHLLKRIEREMTAEQLAAAREAAEKADRKEKTVKKE